MALARSYYISPAFAFVAYPNRDSVPYREWYNIPEADTVVRGTLRYQGFPQFIRALVQLGWLDAEPKEWVKEGHTWAEATKRAAGAKESFERWVSSSKLFLLTQWPCSALVSRVKELCSFPDAAEEVRVISGLRWVGLFSPERLVPRGGNLLDTLCARLETLMSYGPGERDLVMLQHKFVVERSDGTEVRTLQAKKACLALARFEQI